MNRNDNPLAKVLAFLITAYPDHAEELGRITNLFLRDPEKARLELYKYKKANPNIRFPKDLEFLIDQELQRGDKQPGKENDSKKSPTPAERFKKVLEDEFVNKQSNGRISEDYLKEKELSEKEVFEQWYKENTTLGKKNPSEQETKTYKESEEFKTKVAKETDRRYKEKFAAEITGFIAIEKSRIYDNHTNDPVVKELGKILSEAEGENGEGAQKTKKKSLDDFYGIFPQKTIAYSNDIPEIRQYLTEAKKEDFSAPIIMSSPDLEDDYSSEDSENNESENNSTYSPDTQDESEDDQSQRSSSSGRSRGRGKKETEETAKRAERKAERRAARKVGKSGVKKIGQKIASQVGQKAVMALGAATWEIWAIILAIILLLFLLFFLIDQLNNQSGGFVSISKTADKEAVDNPPADSAYLTALSTPQDITYTITVSYSENVQSVTVTDPIPENAILVSANNNAEFLDTDGNPTTDKNLAKTVTWTISPEATSTGSLSGTTSATLGDWLNKKLSGSGLAGQGGALVYFSSKYNIPVELALGMFWHEAQWATTGINPQANNPGNLSNGIVTTSIPKCAKWSAAPDKVGSKSTSKNTYCVYPSMEDGIEAYFKLLDKNYRSQVDYFIQTGDPSKVIAKYYSSANDESGGNAAQYIANINSKVKELKNAAAKDGVSLNAPSDSTGTGSTVWNKTFQIVLRPKSTTKDTYIINIARAENVIATPQGYGYGGVTINTIVQPVSPKGSYNTSEAICVFGNPTRPTSSYGLNQDWYKKNITTTTFLGKKVQVHRMIIPYLEAASQEIIANGITYNIYDIGGFNYRLKVGGSTLSMHAFGSAIDINPDKNPFCYLSQPDCTTNIPSSFVNIMTKWGFGWGGYWKNKKDWMHFQWEGIEPLKGNCPYGNFNYD